MTDQLRVFLPVLIGYLLGSIPFGYVIVKLMRRIDIREYGSHNIGATNVLRVVGWFPALLTLLGDVGKGLLPPVLAVQPVFCGGTVHPWVVVLAPLAAMCGHAYSAYFYLKERQFARGKAVAAGLGALIGFVVAGQVRWPALALVAAVWFGTILLPKLFTRRYGWVSMASILAACTVPFAFLVVHASSPYVIFGIAVALFVVWKHKENIGRFLDGVEPRLGERVPLAGVDKDVLACAFLIHAMDQDDWWQTRRFSWASGLYRAGLISPGVLKRLFLYCRPIKVDTIRGIQVPDGRMLQVHLVCVPWLPEQILAHPKLAVRRAAQAARLAKELGARCLGLGAYWSVVGNKGLEVQQAAPFIPVTNGGAYTAGTMKYAVPHMIGKLRSRGIEPQVATAAVVGGGVVGIGICRQLVGCVGRLIIVGKSQERLEKSAAVLRKRAERTGTEIVTTTDMSACRDAEMIFTATSTIEPVLFSEHVKPGAIIYDLGRPADVDASVATVPGVTVLPGGIVRPPGKMQVRLDTHFGEGEIPACMAETLLIALEGCFDRVSLGDGTKSENIEYFVELGARSGFEVVSGEDRIPEPVEGEVPVPA